MGLTCTSEVVSVGHDGNLAGEGKVKSKRFHHVFGLYDDLPKQKTVKIFLKELKLRYLQIFVRHSSGEIQEAVCWK